MTDLIIGHAHETHLFCQLCSCVKRIVAKCSQSERVAHGGVAVMCYTDPHIVPAIWVWFCSLICCQVEKNVCSCSSAGSTQWGTAPESFYRVQIRCNLRFVAKSLLQRAASKTFCFSSAHFFQSLNSLPPNFFNLRKKKLKAENQAGSQQMWQACRVQRGCVSPTKNSVSHTPTERDLLVPLMTNRTPPLLCHSLDIKAGSGAAAAGWWWCHGRFSGPAEQIQA